MILASCFQIVYILYMSNFKKKPFSIRFDPVILADIRALARYERRSINDEVLFILQTYIDDFRAAHPNADTYPTVDDEISSGIPQS